jgi:hypothetical protein
VQGADGTSPITMHARQRMIEAHQLLEAWKGAHDYYAVMYSHRAGPGAAMATWSVEEMIELHGLQRSYLNAVRDYELSLER